MARILDKEKAIFFRKQGYSYSEIKREIGISKSTLNNWLHSYPLSKNDIERLDSKKDQRIERYRNTMREKRKKVLNKVYEQVALDIGNLTNREIFIAGLFLFFWGGGKTMDGCTSLSNTDPAVVTFFCNWLKILNVPKGKIKVRLQLYADMDIEESVKYWSALLGISKDCFRKSYIKDSKLSALTYKNGFGHGTCMIIVANKILNDYILMGIKYLQNQYSENRP